MIYQKYNYIYIRNSMLTPIMFSYEPYCYNGYTDLVKIQGHLGKLTKRLIFSFMLMFIS